MPQNRARAALALAKAREQHQDVSYDREGWSEMPFMTRVVNSFANNPDQTVQLIEQTLGKGSVMQTSDGNILVRSQDQWVPLDIGMGGGGSSLGDVADLIGELPEIAGETIGGIMGGPLGGAAGSVAGNFARQGIGRMMGLPPSSSPVGDALLSGASGLAGEFAGRGLVNIGKRVPLLLNTRAVKSPVSTAGALALGATEPNIKPISGQLMRDMEREFPKLRFSPAEATDSILIDKLEMISENSLIGSKHLKLFRERQDEYLNEYINAIRDQYLKDLDPTKIGEAVEGVIRMGRDAYKAKSNPLYNSIRNAEKDLIEKEQIQWAMSPRKGKAPFRPVGFGIDFSSVKKLTGELTEGLGGEAEDELISRVSRQPDVITFDRAQKVSSDLYDKIVKYKKGGDSKAQRVAEQMRDTLRNSIEQSLEGVDIDGVPAVDVWKQAAQFHRKSSEVFNNKIIQGLLRKGDPLMGGDPSQIALSLFRKGQVKKAQTLKRAVYEGMDKAQADETWHKLQSFLVEDLFNRSSRPLTAEQRIVSPDALLKNLTGTQEGYYDGTILRAVLGEQTYDKLKTLASVGVYRKQQQKAGSKGAMFITLMQPSAAMTAATGTALTQSPTIAATTLGLTFGPGLIGRMFIDPRTQNLIIKQIRLPGERFIKEGAANAARLQAHANIIYNHEMSQALDDYFVSWVSPGRNNNANQY